MGRQHQGTFEMYGKAFCNWMEWDGVGRIKARVAGKIVWNNGNSLVL